MLSADKMLGRLVYLKDHPFWKSKCGNLLVRFQPETGWAFCPNSFEQQAKLRKTIGEPLMSGFETRKAAVTSYLHFFPEIKDAFQDSFEKTHALGGKSYKHYVVPETPINIFCEQGRWKFEVGDFVHQYPHFVKLVFFLDFKTRRELFEILCEAIVTYDVEHQLEWFWKEWSLFPVSLPKRV